MENSSVATPATYPWWTGATNVSQQWGCTTFTGEGTYIPAGYSCPVGVTHWHHGIDFADSNNPPSVGCQPPTTGLSPGAGSTLLAARGGTVTLVDVPVPELYNHPSDLQFKFSNGYYVNLLHVQSVLSNLVVGSTVTPGEPLATVGDAGYLMYATGCHLHFEVDTSSVLGDNGGFDVDPTPYLTLGLAATAVSPMSGPVTGGTSVVITGSGFLGVTPPMGVRFGATPASS
jgi:hypothetical protein